MLFSPLRLGAITLSHRVVMAPLTRMRAGPGGVPGPLNALYYGQRATPGGLLIAEATPINPQGHGHPSVPGIHTRDQVEGWRSVTRAVHDKGGFIWLQLWHTGRTSHSSHQPDGGPPFAPSAIAGNATGPTRDWQPVPYETPRAMTALDIAGTIAGYRQAALNAIAAGFDGVEIHGANGYLLEQFLQSRSNRRTDGYGGSIANRARLLIEATAAAAEAIGAARVGVRLSPFGAANDSGEAEPVPLYSHAITELAKLGLAWLHLIEPRASGTGRSDAVREGQPNAAALFRPLWPGVLIAAGGFDGAGAAAAIKGGTADAVAFGRLFISNPDLPARLREAAPLAPYHRPTFYGGGEKGYTDYPALETV